MNAWCGLLQVAEVFHGDGLGVVRSSDSGVVGDGDLAAEHLGDQRGVVVGSEAVAELGGVSRDLNVVLFGVLRDKTQSGVFCVPRRSFASRSPKKAASLPSPAWLVPRQ